MAHVVIPPGSDFPLANLPWGVMSVGKDGGRHIAVALGDHAVDVNVLASRGIFNGPHLKSHAAVFAEPTLNAFMALGRPAWVEARARLTEVLTPLVAGGDLNADALVAKDSLVERSNVTMHLPATVGDYTDFYSSIYHATNLGTMFRDANNPLLPNWKHIPVGYHGRASSVVVSGTPVTRPNGQKNAPSNNPPKPVFGATSRLDIELEMGFFVGKGNDLGSPIDVNDASAHIFGMVLMNDWSARDMQKWEYVPLGPFLGKSFATTISPWIVTLDALAPFKIPAMPQEPAPLPYLQQKDAYTFDINLSVDVKREGMKAPKRVSETNFKHMYWTQEQQLTHHASNGCEMRAGDLCGSGTISGPTKGSFGSFIEMTWGGKEKLDLGPDAVNPTLVFANDGDEITLKGFAEKDGVRIGFGDCVGEIFPAPEYPSVC